MVENNFDLSIFKGIVTHDYIVLLLKKKIVSEQSNKMDEMVRIAVTAHKVQYCLKLDYSAMLVLMRKMKSPKYIFVAIGLTINAKANINGNVVIKQFTMSHLPSRTISKST
jgi:hypothetical protein